MAKVSVVVLADTTTGEALGRVSNAFELAKEADQAGDDVEILFDGAGVKWVTELKDEEHRLRPLYDEVKHRVKGACEYCAGAFGVKEGVEDSEVELVGEFDGHPSLRRRLEQGYQIVTF